MIRGLIGASLLASVSAGAVLAQETVDGPGGNPAGGESQQASVMLEDILVTARRRSEPLQRTPVAVTALGESDIEARQAVNIIDIAASIPNVRIDAVGQMGRAGMLAIRGINYARPDTTGDPSIAFYVDGLYQTRSTINILNMFDIQSVEVLRGPQGTLFGRNAFAGAINIQSKRPDPYDSWGGQAEARVGNHGRHEFLAALHVPIVEDVLAMRVSGFYSKSDGYYNLINEGGKSFGGDDHVSGKLMFRFMPNDDWDILAKYEIVRDRGDPTPNKNASSPGQLFGNLPGDPPNAWIGGPYDVNFNLLEGQKSFVDQDILMVNATREWSSGSLNLITGYQAIEDGLMVDPASGNQPYLNNYYVSDVEVFSQEARILQEINDRFQIMAGLYYQYDTVRFGNITTSTYGPLLGANAEVRTRQNRDSFAAFAELQVHATDTVRINLAGRQMHEKKTFDYARQLRDPAMSPGEFLPEPVYERDSVKWNNFSPKASIDWEPLDDLMLFASWTRGFKSGGYASISTSMANAGPYHPEKIETFEVGVKSFLFDHSVRLNVTGFWNNLSDLQRQVNFIVGGAPNSLVFNAASAVTRGFEVETEARPTADLMLRGSVGYTDAYYKSFCANLGLAGTPCDDGFGTPGAVDNSHLKLYNAPKWQFSASAEYYIDLNDLGSLTLFGVIDHTTPLYTTDNNLDSRRGPRTVVNASVRWTSADERYYGSIFAHNLFNERDIQQNIRVDPTLTILNYTPPRRIGVSVGVRF